MTARLRSRTSVRFGLERRSRESIRAFTWVAGTPGASFVSPNLMEASQC